MSRIKLYLTYTIMIGTRETWFNYLNNMAANQTCIISGRCTRYNILYEAR
jgi:hypothetical protein